MTISLLSSEGYDAQGATGLVYLFKLGPTIRSRGILTYGMSSDPSSSHYSDQMAAYGRAV